MRIACNRCEAGYDLPEDRLDRGPVKIRCKRCGHVFAVRRRQDTAGAQAPAGQPSAEELFSPLREQEPFPAEAPAPSFNLPEPEPPSDAVPAARFEDFDFASFESAPVSEPPPPEPAGPARTPSLFEEEDLPSLGELDLSDFGESGGLGGLDAEGGGPEPGAPREVEPERVRSEDLLRPPPSLKEVPVQGLADALPRLDLQKGPRRPEPVARTGGRTSPRDRRRSPLVWVVAAAAVAVGSWTAYNLWRQTPAATFLDPARLKELWLTREVEARFATEDLKGYPLTLPGGRRVFVIRGRVVNNSGSPQGPIRVKGSLFGPDGARIASVEAYCGNVLSDRELAVLPKATVEARLLNQVGEGLSNVDIAPGRKVPFQVVFFSPSARVEKFSVNVSAARRDTGS